ncbi:M6 family metalloprotease domain-containing protein [Methanosarcina sp. T3]|uniref:M6 family metalloprotease domain-containing protein n=1 Tax=Methanosarcina sp. T3 TaxID=3439062 RepID=UPI003F8370B0
MSAINGEILTFSQEKGPDVKLRVFGDEFYSRYENLDGYTVVYDIDLGRFCYAHLIKGEFVSSGVDLSRAPPEKIWRHLKESEQVRNSKFETRYARMKPPAEPYQPIATLKTFGPNKGLLEGRRLSKGDIKGLTILVQFKDVKSTVTREDVDNMLNGENYTENGNFCSVREYFQLMSGGKLNYTNVVVGPVTLSKNRQYYTQHLLVEEALDLAIASGVDLNMFDSQDEGIVDAINFLYAGQTQYIGELWPHNYFLKLKRGNMETHFYMLSSLGRSKEDMSIGTLCHENGHMLCRWPDLYDYGVRDGDFEKSAGLGYYCLMSAGNHNDNGRTPSPVCAYFRYLVDWCDNVVFLDKPDEYQAVHGDYNTVHIFKSRKCHDEEFCNEFFLIENRSQLGLDKYAPSSGLAVYHCDTLGSNEWQGGTSTKHYQCGLLQADGHLDLETNRNRGDEMDLFKEKASTAISHNTLPSSNLWDGSESGLIISNISAPGQIVTFQVGTSGISPTIQAVKPSIEEKEIPKPAELIKIIEEAQVKIDEGLEKLRAIA